MVLLEAQVHSSLLGFLREHNPSSWPHHLTMARIVSRSLRLNCSALIQTGTTDYSLSYLTAALLSDQPVILVAPPAIQQRLLNWEIPQLQEWLQQDKAIVTGDYWPSSSFQGLLLVTPPVWLGDRLDKQNRFPANILTIIDQANELETWARDYLTVSLTNYHWEQLITAYPHQAEKLRDLRIKLTKSIFSHPWNPYNRYPLALSEIAYLQQLESILSPDILLPAFLAQFLLKNTREDHILWTSVDRSLGSFTLHLSPSQIATQLSSVWREQPIVIMGSFLDSDKNATIYRQQLGLKDLLSLKFAPNRNYESIRLYVPDRLPLPNTPQFQGVLREQTHRLVSLCQPIHRPIVILVEDVPLQAQLAVSLAATFGSRVQVEKVQTGDQQILLCGWAFWHQYQDLFPTPQLLVIATLPLPSLENPLVAGRVAYYKRQRQDWFRLYLLPTALNELQRAVMPLRESQGIVALLDNRVHYRSYGTQILVALEPYARINYESKS
jgi:ATP-dependent DNA helicase DinG